MKNGNYTWPEDIPVNCPLDGNEPTEGIFFRVVFTDPPTHSDFLMSVDDPNLSHLNLKTKFGELSNTQQCEAFSASHFSSLEKSMRIAVCKNRVKKAFVAELNLVPDLGVMKPTGQKTHYSIWFQKGSAPWDFIVKLHSVGAANAAK